MKFDLISDFHVEFNVMYSETIVYKDGEPAFFAWHKARKNPILVIAGDISNMTEVSMDIIEEAADYYEQVIWTDGNHEHYSGYKNHSKYSLTQNMEKARVQATRDLENVTYLDGETYIIQDGTMFVGANGWYDFKMAAGYHTKEQYRQWQRHSNDPVCIRFGKKNRPEKMADRQSTQIAKMVKDAQDDERVKEIVVVTHTIPHRDGMIKNPAHEWYPLNGAYGSSLMHRVRTADLSQKKIRAWVFGHTHYVYDFFHEGIHYVCNPRGYRGEMRWDKNTPSGLVFSGIKEVDTEELCIKSAFGEPDE